MSAEKWECFNSLHPQVVTSLKEARFQRPTQIQDQLFTNYKYYSDFLVAAQTGSGKTLAFAAPIISDLIYFSEKSTLPNKILLLILTPTRELAQQIEGMINIIIENTNVRQSLIVGGLSVDKQIRVLKKKKPHILVGTPGRLHELLNNQFIQFSNLKYLVIDEADRMIELGHYVELDEILNKIFNPKVEEFFEHDFHEIEKSLSKKKSKQDFFIVQQGKKVKLNFDMHSFQTDKLFEIPSDLFTIYDPNQEKKKNKKSKQQKKPKEEEVEVEVVQPQIMQAQEDQVVEEEPNQLWQKLKRKVFFISATLTREFKGTKYFTKKKKKQEKGKSKSKDKKNKKKEQEEEKEEEDDFCPKLKALLSRINFNSKPKIIDQSSELFLPPKLKECYSFCLSEEQKIAIMLCYLKQQPKGSKIIIFGNTIKASKRIQYFISAAGYKSVLLHSHMLQKQRLLKLEKFKKSNVNILISTDVAARGLDFQISNVIQYGVPVNGDTYVHRAGRTARANKQGQALMILSEKQANRWEQISNIIGKQRKVHKYAPPQLMISEMNEKVERYQWVRIHEQKMQNRKIESLNKMEADELGIQVDEQVKKKKFFKEDEEIFEHSMKKKVQKVKNMNKAQNIKNSQIGDGKVWKKNKLVLSLEEIKKFL